MAIQNASLGLAVKSVFSAVITGASALEKVAQIADNLGTIGVESTQTMIEETRLDRQVKIDEIKARIAAQKKATLLIENAAEATA